MMPQPHIVKVNRRRLKAARQREEKKYNAMIGRITLAVVAFAAGVTIGILFGVEWMKHLLL